MATSTIDPGYLAAYLSLPEPTITTLLDTPTVELVQAVLAAVTAKAHEHEDLKAEKLRVDIELESAVRSAESRSQGLKASVDKALNDVEQLRNKLTEEGSASPSTPRILLASYLTCDQRTYDRPSRVSSRQLSRRLPPPHPSSRLSGPASQILNRQTAKRSPFLKQRQPPTIPWHKTCKSSTPRVENSASKFLLYNKNYKLPTLLFPAPGSRSRICSKNWI